MKATASRAMKPQWIGPGLQIRQRILLNTLLLVLLTLLSAHCFACTCRSTVSLEDAIETSEAIFVAEVVSKKLASKQNTLEDHELVELDVKLRVLKTLKGKIKRTFYAVGYDWASHYDGSDVVMAGGCHRSVIEGDRYLILHRKGRPVELVQCSPYAWPVDEDSEAKTIANVNSLLLKRLHRDEAATQPQRADTPD